MKRSRLLIVDSPGGPLPSTYLPMLPKDIDIYFIQLQPADSQKAQKRLRDLQACATVHVVATQNQLKDEIEKIEIL